MAKTGIILCNIGTPKSYEVQDVKKYLLKFLMDEDIISIPFLVRWFLVHGIIVPRRASFSAENYKKIWMHDGSPLWVYSKKFAEKLQQEMGSDFVITLGMRYSEPSIETALKELSEKNVEKILVIPMFPQYADATTSSVMKEFKRAQNKTNIQIPARILPHFYADKNFIEPTVNITQEYLEDKNIDHYLFSFHGLPESHVRRNETCLRTSNCCLSLEACNKPCYRAQCNATAAEIAKSLGLSADQWSISFQSRLGRGEWLKPSTETTLEALAASGKKNIAVSCPSFVSDCIETLEEIAIGGQETFKHAGGQNFYMIPCVNDDSRWVQGFAKTLKTFKDQR
jgi:ferrochelatase